MELNTEQLKVVKSMMFKTATDGDLKAVKEICRARGLDPFAGHVLFDKYKDKIIVTTTIDGARTKAAKTGEYAGSDKPIFHGDGKGLSCEITVYRMINGQRCGFTAELLMNEFYPPSGKDHQWKRMPRHMLAKCTEMAALKKGFSDVCGGEYEQSEHIATDDTPEIVEEKILDVPSNAARWAKVKAAFAVHGIDELTLLADEQVADKVEDLTESHFEFLHKWYLGCQDAANN